MAWYLTDPARDDLDGIWFHIASDNAAAADKMVARLVERFDMLARQPLIGEACPELKAELRNFPLAPTSSTTLPKPTKCQSSVSCMALGMPLVSFENGFWHDLYHRDARLDQVHFSEDWL